MKDFFGRKKKDGADNDPKLGGVFFGFSERGKKHVVSLKDMPEDVRAYFEEAGKQIYEENGDGGVVTINADNMPDYVNEYMNGQISRVLDDIKEDEIGELRLSDLPREAVQECFFDMIDASFERYAKKYPECREDLKPSVGPLKLIANILLNTDEDWQDLKVKDAARLYGGVAMAMMESVIVAHNLNKVGWEDKNDEEDS